MKKLKNWWHGEFKVKEDDYFTHFYIDRSPWARRMEATVAWASRNSWNITFLIVGLAGLWVAL